MRAIPFLLWAAAVAQQEREAPEYDLKAAFLYNFATFIEWPTTAFREKESSFTVGVIGKDPFGSTLEDTFRGKTVGGRRIEVVRSSDVKELKVCHVVFIPVSENKQAPKILETLKGTHALTVGEDAGFAKGGGCINFYFEGKKIRFEINPAAAKEANLKISSKLLRLARVVEGKE